jgi:hypothetical protein
MTSAGQKTPGKPLESVGYLIPFGRYDYSRLTAAIFNLLVQKISQSTYVVFSYMGAEENNRVAVEIFELSGTD